MNRYVYALVESYYDSTTQMNNLLKDAERTSRAEERARQTRTDFVRNVLGKTTFNRFDNNGLFAPLPLSALHLTKKDFDDLSTSFGEEKTHRLVDVVGAKYFRNDFKLYDDGNNGAVLQTNVVFRTIDDVIDFFVAVLRAFKRVYRSEDVNWKPLVKKFREYLK